MPAPEHSDPAGLGARSDLIGALERISIEAVLTVQSIAPTSDLRFPRQGSLLSGCRYRPLAASVQYSGARLCTLTVNPRGEEEPVPRLQAIVINCREPALLARFYAELLGLAVSPQDAAARRPERWARKNQSCWGAEKACICG